MYRSCALLLCLTATAEAAVWPSAAPCNATLQACIDAQPAGDAVLIRSSATIDEEIVLNKRFSLFAAPGYRPVLANSRSIVVSAPAAASFYLELSGIDITRGRLSVLAGAATDVSVRLERVNLAAGVFANGIEIVGGSGVLSADIRNCRVRLPANPAEPGHSGIAITALGSQAQLQLFHNRIELTGSTTGAGIRLRNQAGVARFNAVGNFVEGRSIMAGINAVQGGSASVLNANFVSNVVTGQAGGVEAPGALSVRVDSGTGRVVLRHNTLVRNAVGIALDGNLAPSAVDRNLIAWNGAGLLIAPAQQGQVGVDNNLFHANPSNAYLAGSGNLAADPRLRSGRDLRPAADSPALGAATFVNPINPLETLPQLDADGLVLGSNNADIGAYQRHGAHVLHRVSGGSGLLAGAGIPAGAFVPFVVSQNWNPGGGIGVYNDRAIGLTHGGQWRLFNQDGSSLPEGSAFNVFVPARNALTHQDGSASTSNSGSPFSGLPTSLSQNPDLFWLFTLNRMLTPTVGTLNPHPVALLFFTRWGLHNTDAADFPQNASYALYWQELSPNAYVHYVSPANRGGHITTLDHPLLNGNPCARLQFSAATAGGVFNPHELGAYYNGARWALFNQDFAPLTDDASMHVLVDPAQAEFCDRIFDDTLE